MRLSKRLCAAGCSKDSKDSSSATESKANVSTADNADGEKSEDSKGNESDADSKVVNEQGELITKTAAIFDGDYTLKTTCTEADGSDHVHEANIWFLIRIISLPS